MAELPRVRGDLRGRARQLPGDIDDYDARFPRGSCRSDSNEDRFAYAKTLPDGVLGLRKAPRVQIDAPDDTTTTTTTTTTRIRRQPRRLQFITDTTNTGEHQELRRLRQSDPELYELKLFEWDYVSQIDDLQETTPDLDDPGAPEVFFAVSGQQDEPATRTSSFVGARTTHLG